MGTAGDEGQRYNKTTSAGMVCDNGDGKQWLSIL